MKTSKESMSADQLYYFTVVFFPGVNISPSKSPAYLPFSTVFYVEMKAQCRIPAVLFNKGAVTFVAYFSPPILPLQPPQLEDRRHC